MMVQSRPYGNISKETVFDKKSSVQQLKDVYGDSVDKINDLHVINT